LNELSNNFEASEILDNRRNANEIKEKKNVGENKL